MGDLERCLRALRGKVIAIEIHGGGVEVGMVCGDRKAFQCRYRQCREDPLRAHLVETIEHPSDIVVAEVLRRQLLAEQHGPVTVLERGVQMVERAASRQCIEHQAQNDQTRLHLHLRRHQAIDDLHQPQASRKVGNDR
jgi:hypothetical protein